MSDKKLEEFDEDELGVDSAKDEDFDAFDDVRSPCVLGSPGTSHKKVKEALDSLFNPELEKKDGDPYKFTYVSVAEVRKKIQPGIVFNWGAEGVGFGQIALSQHDGELEIDDEHMGKEFIKEMFGYFIDEYYKKKGK